MASSYLLCLLCRRNRGGYRDWPRGHRSRASNGFCPGRAGVRDGRRGRGHCGRARGGAFARRTLIAGVHVSQSLCECLHLMLGAASDDESEKPDQIPWVAGEGCNRLID